MKDTDDDVSDHLFNWESLSCEFDDEEFESVLDDLKQIAPYIRWRLVYHEHDLGVYRMIEVPIDQCAEAQFIVEKYENGEDLSDYSSEDRYPEVYIKHNDGKRQIHPDVLSFYHIANEYDTLLYNANSYNQAQLFSKLAELLLQLYAFGLRLPEGRDNVNIVESSDIGYRVLDFGNYENFYYVSDPFIQEEPYEQSLSELIFSILEEIQNGVHLFEDAKPDEIAKIVCEWKIGFEYGWGTDTIIALNVIHKALQDIKDKELRILLGKKYD